jgi:hypothetical protein
VGQSIALNGLGFGANETVLIYANSTVLPPIYTATTDASGSFAITSTVLPGYYGPHPLIAVGQASHRSASSSFFITAASALQRSSGPQGSANGLGATGFGPGEAIQVTWTPGGVTVGSGTTNAQGTAVIAFTTPRVPGGLYHLTATGQRTHLSATSPFLLTPTLGITPTSGVAGSGASVAGSGFGANEVVIVRWDCASRTCTSTTILGAVQVDASGDFSSLGVQIPSAVSVGVHAVGAAGSTSHTFAATTFNVSP